VWGTVRAGKDRAVDRPSPLQNGGTPLLYAVRGNHVKCVEALLGELQWRRGLGKWRLGLGTEVGGRRGPGVWLITSSPYKRLRLGELYQRGRSRPPVPAHPALLCSPWR
jgi:hypothetical protein